MNMHSSPQSPVAPRARTTARGITAALSVLLILWSLGCSSGGGGSSGPGPVIVAASFIGGATPQAGNTLNLFLSQDVTLVQGQLLDDDAVILSNGTLGNVTMAPTQVSPRSIHITLGAGVSFTPGSTTIAFSDANSAVIGAAGTPASGGTPQVIATGDGDSPVVDNVTVNALPTELNGSGPAGGTVQAPQNGFSIDIDYSDASSAIATAATVILADIDVLTAAGVVGAGSNLASALTPTHTAAASSFAVPSTTVFPQGMLSLTIYVLDNTGMASAPRSYTLLIKAMNDADRPFETNVNSKQWWFIDTSRDIESYNYNSMNFVTPVEVVDGKNGTPDLRELWTLLGVLGSDPAVNTTVTTRLTGSLRTEMAALYPNVNVAFTTSSPGAFPNNAGVPYGSFTFSQICVAGSFDTSGSMGILGLALFDPNNASQDNDCLTDFDNGSGPQRLGVFMHTMINAGISGAPLSLFRRTYDPLTSVKGGTPIGNAVDGMDAARLAGTLQDPRSTVIDTAIARMARSIAVVTAHECGHSMGLVHDGAMPDGLYGGDNQHFPGSSAGHINNDSLFPGPSQNVMSPAISFVGATAAETNFNPLNLAYLREQVLYNN